jgi:histone deacetylase complex regulatory component SIN3
VDARTGARPRAACRAKKRKLTDISDPIDAARQAGFFETVKQRLDNPVLYAEFLKCLSLFSQEVISRSDLIVLLEDVLGKFPDLVQDFAKFFNISKVGSGRHRRAERKCSHP